MKGYGIKISLVLALVILAVTTGCGIKANPVKKSDGTAKHQAMNPAEELPVNS